MTVTDRMPDSIYNPAESRFFDRPVCTYPDCHVPGHGGRPHQHRPIPVAPIGSIDAWTFVPNYADDPETGLRLPPDETQGPRPAKRISITITDHPALTDRAIQRLVDKAGGPVALTVEHSNLRCQRVVVLPVGSSCHLSWCHIDLSRMPDGVVLPIAVAQS